MFKNFHNYYVDVVTEAIKFSGNISSGGATETLHQLNKRFGWSELYSMTEGTEETQHTKKKKEENIKGKRKINSKYIYKYKYANN